MINFNCWGCGKSLKAKDAHAGKQCKCNHCGRQNTVPAQDAPAEEEPLEFTFEKPIEVSPPTSDIPEIPTLRAANPNPAVYKLNEPWYFKAIEIWCYLNLILASIGAVLVIVVFAYTIAENLRFRDKLYDAVAAAFVGFIGTGLMLFAWITLWAVILVALDVARNIRGIRHAAFRILEK